MKSVSPVETEDKFFQRRNFESEFKTYRVRFSALTNRCSVWDIDKGVKLFEVGCIRNLESEKSLEKISGIIDLYEKSGYMVNMFYV